MEEKILALLFLCCRFFIGQVNLSYLCLAVLMCVFEHLDSSGHFCISLIVSMCIIPEDGNEMLVLKGYKVSTQLNESNTPLLF